MRNVKEITITAILSVILFIQEQALMLLPNIQLTILLIIVYARAIGIKRTIIIVIIHTMLDSLLWGFDIRYFLPMLVGWLIIPITLGTLFKKVSNPIMLAFLGIIYAFIYSWFFSIPYLLISTSAFYAYLSADIVYEIILAASSFVTIMWLYEPLKKMLEKLDNGYFNNK